MKKYHKTAWCLKIALALGLWMSVSGAYAQTGSEKDNQRPGKLSGLSYKQNNPSTMTNGLILFPNPASEEIDVKLPNALKVPYYEGFYISILNQDGAAVVDKPWFGEKLDVSELEPGIYVIVVNKGRLICTQKLVVER